MVEVVAAGVVVFVVVEWITVVVCTGAVTVLVLVGAVTVVVIAGSVTVLVLVEVVARASVAVGDFCWRFVSCAVGLFAVLVGAVAVLA